MSDSCQLTGTIPEAIGGLTSLASLDLSNNMLTGTLPDSVGSLSNIKTFAIATNLIAGKLSDSIGNWEKLQHLLLFKNRFTGPLPSTISAWTDLISFDVHVSYWIWLPVTTFYDLARLIRSWSFICSHRGAFSGQDNEFNGMLPPVTWKNLQFFYVGDNTFSGTLSESIGSFSKLTTLRIENNRFTGTLPSSIGLWTELKEFYTAGDSPPGNAFNFEVSTSVSSWVEIILTVMNSRRCKRIVLMAHCQTPLVHGRS